MKSLENEKEAVSLHPISPPKTANSSKRFLEIFLKKDSKKFGSSKNMVYLCTAFPP